MYRVVVGYKNWNDLRTLSAALEQSGDFQIVSAEQSAQGVYDAAIQMDADVVLLSPLVTGYRPELVRDLLYHEEKPIPVIGMVPAVGDYAQEMYDQGAKGHVTTPLDHAQVRKLLELIPQAVQQAEAERADDSYIPLSRDVLATVADKGWQARTVAVWSPKGGVGKSWFAVNLAVALGVVGMRRTILVDADMNKADCHVYLHLPEQRNLFGLASQVLNRNGRVEVPPTLFSRYTTHYLGERNSKLDLLVGIPRMHLAGMPEFQRKGRTRDFMVEVVRTASRLYDFRILDVGQDFNHPVHWACIQEADIVLVLVTPELHCINDVKNVLPPLRETFGDLTKFEIVINRWNEDYGVPQKDIVDVLGMKKFGVIPDAPRRCVISLNSHRPVVLDRPDEIADAVATVAANFFPPLEEIWLARGGRIGGSRKFRREKPKRGDSLGRKILSLFVE